MATNQHNTEAPAAVSRETRIFALRTAARTDTAALAKSDLREVIRELDFVQNPEDEGDGPRADFDRALRLLDGTTRSIRILAGEEPETVRPDEMVGTLYAIKHIVDRIDSLAALAGGSTAEGFRHLEGWRIVECEATAAGEKLKRCIDNLESRHA